MSLILEKKQLIYPAKRRHQCYIWYYAKVRNVNPKQLDAQQTQLRLSLHTHVSNCILFDL